MGSFRISVDSKYKKTILEKVKNGEKISAVDTYTPIKVIIDGKTFGGKVTDSDWLWYFCENWIEEILKINDSKEHVVKFNDNPIIMKFRKELSQVIIGISYKGNSVQTQVPYSEFMGEIFSFVDSFVSDLVSINPRILENDQFKQIIEGRDKIKKMLEGAKK